MTSMPIDINALENVTGGIGPIIIEQKVTYHDAAGNEYTIVVKPRQMPDIIQQRVTYSDGNNTTYTLEVDG